MTSVVDYMAQPSTHHEPASPPTPVALLVDADTFETYVGFSGFIEHDAAANRAYTTVGKCRYAVELDGAA